MMRLPQQTFCPPSSWPAALATRTPRRSVGLPVGSPAINRFQQ